MNTNNNHPQGQNNQKPEENVDRPLVDPNSIAKFHNPQVPQNNQAYLQAKKIHEERNESNHNLAEQSGHLVAAKETSIPKIESESSSHSDIKKHPTNDKKAEARIKLIKMRKQSHWHTIRFALISFVVFLFIFNFQLIYSQAQFFIKSRSNPKVASTTPITPPVKTTQAEVVEGPDVIIIPKLNVTAPLVFIDTTEERSVLTALQNGVVHYAGTALPGENGNSVFFGHSSNDLWEKGNYKFVFALLEKLNVGDQYEIHYQSKKYVYIVEETKVVAPTDLSVLNQTPTPYSTLITCTPPGTSWRRFIVKGKQLNAPSSTQVANTNNIKTANTNVLPSAPPTVMEQIQIAISNFINSILGKNNNSTQQPSNTTPSTQPASHLPEVSAKIKMPVTF